MKKHALLSWFACCVVPVAGAADSVTVERAVNARLNLQTSQVVRMTFERTATATLKSVVPIESSQRTLELEPVSLRTADYELVAQVAGGSYVSLEPGLAHTYRGRVVGIEGSVVAASRLDGALHAMIRLPDGTRYWVEPLEERVAGAEAGDHVVYRDTDLGGSNGGCGYTEEGDAHAEGESTDQGTGGVAAGTVHIAELAVDADVEYFEKYGSVLAVEAQVHKVINTMNIEYERDLNIRHLITRIIVRTANPDPYSANDAGPLVNQLRDHWFGSQQSVPRDVVQLFTGRNLSGGILGIAMRSGMCFADQAYCLVASDSPSCPNLACKTDLSAHELGHVWSAGHCSCPGWTMNPTITSGNRFHPVFDIPGMIAFRNAKTCLSFADSCLGTGTVDCNENGTADPCDVASGTSADADANGTPDECQPPPMPLADSTLHDKNRAVSIVLPTAPTLAVGARTAVRVEMLRLERPVPQAGEPPQDFSAFESGPTCTDSLGCGRWLGPPVTVREQSNGPSSDTLQVSRLQCTPYYHDWTVEGVVQVVGAEMLPSSAYGVASVLERCLGNEDSCDLVSSSNLLTTSRYGDVAFPWAPPSSETQPDALDIVAVVDRFKGLEGAPSKILAQLQPNLPDLHAEISGLDIVASLDAYQGNAYPYSGPCPCPATVICNTVACSGGAGCGSGTCVRACSGGEADGQPCSDSAHCPNGNCGSGFCRDRCGRCSP